jgi:hypothetical protein
MIEISTSFYETTRALSDRINGTVDSNGKVLASGLRQQLKEVKRQNLVKQKEIEALRSYAEYTMGLSSDSRQKNIAVAKRQEDEYLGAERELNEEIREIESKMNNIQFEYGPAARLADALLSYAGLDMNLQQTVSYPCDFGKSA